MNKEKETHFKTVSLISIVLGNPVIFYLLYDNIILSLLSFLIVLLLVFIFFFFFRKLFSLIISFLIIIATFINIEVIFIYNFNEFVIEDLYEMYDNHYFNKPNLDKTITDKEYTSFYYTNSQGYRIHNYQNPETTINNCDWLFLGDSYTQAAQVNNSEIFSSNLYRNFPNKVIINAGISGFGITEEFLLLKKLKNELNPKTVFLQVCSFNDFMNVNLKEYNFLDYLMHYSDYFRFLFSSIKYKNPDELPLGRWAEPFYQNEINNINYNIFYKKSSEMKKQDIENFKNYFVEFVEFVRDNNIKLVVFLIPTKEQVHYRYFNEVITEFGIDVDQLDMRFPNRLMKDLTDSLDVLYIDLLPSFLNSDKELFFEFDEHLNKDGHDLLAKELSHFIKKSKLSESKIQYLSQNSLNDRYPSYFADYDSILIQSTRDFNSEILVADYSFHNLKQISYNTFDESHPSINKDNFTCFTEGKYGSSETEVIIFNNNNYQKQTITSQNNFFGAIPTFSKDGEKVVFSGWFSDSLKSSYTPPQIYIYDIKTETSYNVFQNNFENWRPAFSPNDSLLVYISKRTDNFDIFVFDLFEKMEIQITNTSYDEWDPRFDNTQNQLILYSGFKNNNWDLFYYDIFQKKEYQITSTRGDEWDGYMYSEINEILYAGEFGFFNGIYRMKNKAFPKIGNK
ncbi:MAG: hypothetical protein D8M58_21825 [Calditrichaeota bacterium]|nr:MAG: hypothetical protein DWQ03_00650 [Calditrichota bacterium]MBL1208055.1 hypothetical protein [Calditrichota bacterium]NOG47891.1 hypothetical protein [Calditrichota bacterium]